MSTPRPSRVDGFVTIGVLAIVAFFVVVTVWRGQTNDAFNIVIALVGYLGGRVHSNLRMQTKDGMVVESGPASEDENERKGKKAEKASE